MPYDPTDQTAKPDPAPRPLIDDRYAADLWAAHPLSTTAALRAKTLADATMEPIRRRRATLKRERAEQD